MSRPGRRSGSGRARSAATAARRPVRPRFTGRAAILVLVVAVLVVSYASSMRAFLEQEAHLESLRDDIATSQANIAELEREKRRWKDPAYVEAQTRQRLGWVMPGEIGYQVIGEDGQPLSRDESLTEVSAETEAGQKLWWQKAWESVQIAGNPPEEKPGPVDEIRAPKRSKKQ